jgi:RNA recognition motif-containing protein
MDIFVGSLPFKIRERDLQEIFEKYGEVSSVKIVIDHQTRQNKGFGFVKMPDEHQARHAIAELNGVELEGRPLVVNESKFKKEPGRGDEAGSRPARSSRPAASGGSGGGFPKKNDSNRNPSFSRGSYDKSKGGKSTFGKDGSFGKKSGPKGNKGGSRQNWDD